MCNDALWFRKRKAIAVELLKRALWVGRVRVVGGPVVRLLTVLDRLLERLLLQDQQALQIAQRY